jgi:ubiquitin C
MLFRGVDGNDLGLWGEARARTNSPVELWKTVVGIEADGLQDASLFRVIEWGGMEVR